MASWLSRLIYGNRPGPTQAAQGYQEAIARGPFDPGAALQDYAGGAYSDFQSQLSKELEKLSGRAVGQGRFDSGFFDQDQGEVVTELGRGFTSDLARQSLGLAGLRQRAGEDYNELLAGQLDREMEERNARRRQRGSTLGGLGRLAGAGAGFLVGGPPGAVAGYKLTGG